MKLKSLLFILILPGLIYAGAVQLRSLGPNTNLTNPTVPSPKFYGTFSQMLTEPVSLLQCGDTWDTSDTQSEYIFSCPASVWVFSVHIYGITATPTPTNVPASSWTPTITPTPTNTPTGSWTPIPTFTPTVLATIGVMFHVDYNPSSFFNPSSVFLHQENLLSSDNLQEWGLTNPAFAFGMRSALPLALFGRSDNNQSEILLGNGSIGLFVAQDNYHFFINNGNIDLQGGGPQQVGWFGWRRSLSPNVVPLPVTLVNGAATVYDPNLPIVNGTPQPSCYPVTYIGTPVFLPVVKVEAGGNTLTVKGGSTDDGIYQILPWSFY